MEDKISTAFLLYDVDGDGKVTFQELVLYLASVFKVLLRDIAQLRKQMDLEMSPGDLVRTTAYQLRRGRDHAGIDAARHRTFSRFVRTGLGGCARKCARTRAGWMRGAPFIHREAPGGGRGALALGKGDGERNRGQSCPVAGQSCHVY